MSAVLASLWKHANAMVDLFAECGARSTRIEVHLSNDQLAVLRNDVRVGEWMDGQRAAEQEGTHAVAIFGGLVIRQKNVHGNEPHNPRGPMRFFDPSEDYSQPRSLR